MQNNFESRAFRWVYRRLSRAFGKQHWWPAKSAFEVIVGAILTQGTAWRNVEKSIQHLREKRALSPQRLHRMTTEAVARTIRSSGFFRVKARRLKSFIHYLFRRWGGDLNKMFQVPTGHLREELLAIPGLGNETVDSILLYAGGKPTFVVDAYTRRIFSRHGLFSEKASYDAVQHEFMEALPRQSALFNEYHALLVEVGKRYCHRRAPHCRACPLDPLPRTKAKCKAFLKEEKML